MSNALLTLELYKTRLASGYYQTKLIARRSLAKSHLSDKDKRRAYELCSAHWDEPAPVEKVITTKKHRPKVSFVVVFARVANDPDAHKLVTLLKGAADSGYTLPQLISDLEEVRSD